MMHENSTRKPLKLHFTQYLTVLYANEVHDDFNSGLQIMSEKSIQNNESAVLYFSQWPQALFRISFWRCYQVMLILYEGRMDSDKGQWDRIEKIMSYWYIKACNKFDLCYFLDFVFLHLFVNLGDVQC